MKPKHPGKIFYYEWDPITKEEILTSTELIKNIPESLRFGDTPDGFIPVVKVVMIPKGQNREIIEYGPNGQFLRSTIQYQMKKD